MENMEVWDKLICPKCKGTKWRLGPRGGLARNVECKCGARFNIVGLPNGKFWVEDISSPTNGEGE